MLRVVPGDESYDPFACGFQAFEGLDREVGAGLDRAETGLRKRVVVGDAGAAKGNGHAETLQHGQGRSGFHGSTVVGVQDQGVPCHGFRFAGRFNEPGGELCVLFQVYLPPHDFPTPHIDEHVEVEEGAFDGCAQIGDVPGPHHVGSRAHVLVRAGAFGGLLACAAVGHLVCFPEDAIQRALGAVVLATIGKEWDDLLGALVSEFSRVHPF